jgi:4-hydroxy-tetrahydrodipicolinate reductase
LVDRVIQWGAGNNAQALIRAVRQHPDLELVGCRVWSEEKDGIDAGVLAGIGPIGIRATRDAQSLVATGADVVLFLPAMLPDTTESDREAIELLRSGESVISLTGDHSMPAAAGNGFGEAVEEACRISDSTFTSTGVNLGFIAERLGPSPANRTSCSTWRPTPMTAPSSTPRTWSAPVSR